jgi:hypothetical protein
MEQLTECPVCSNRLSLARLDDSRTWHLECPVCGTYAVTEEGVDELAEKKYQSQKPLIYGTLRYMSDRKRPFTIQSDNLDDLIAAARPPKGPLEAVDLIIGFLRERTQYFGQYLKLAPSDLALTYSINFKEFENYLNLAKELGLLEGPPSSPEYALTSKGWQRLEEMSRIRPKGNVAFVAMNFSNEFKPAWSDGFKPCLIESGFNPVRMDLVEHNDKIDDRIVAEIRRSSLLVADFTGNRGGVYFEAGYALGLGLPVIWTCREDFIEQVHFDTRQYNHVLWRDPAELKVKLSDRIHATIVL